MKTIEVKLNDYNAPTELPTSIIDLLNEEKRLLEKIKMVADNKVIIREQILKREGDALKEQLESMFSKIGMTCTSRGEVSYNDYSIDIGFSDYHYASINFKLEVPTKRNEELSRRSRIVWEYGTELNLFVSLSGRDGELGIVGCFFEFWGNIDSLRDCVHERIKRLNQNYNMGKYTDFDLSTFMERNFNTIKDIIVIRNNQIKV